MACKESEDADPEFRSKRRRSRKRWLTFDAIIFFMAVAIIVPLVGPSLGKLEGAFHPVVRQFTIQRIIPLGYSGSFIYGEISTLRPECSFTEIRWFIEELDVTAPVDITYLENARIRPRGVSDFGPWRITIHPDSLEDSRAVVLHQCPYRPWLTETALFPTVED